MIEREYQTHEVRFKGKSVVGGNREKIFQTRPKPIWCSGKGLQRLTVTQRLCRPVKEDQCSTGVSTIMKDKQNKLHPSGGSVGAY